MKKTAIKHSYSRYKLNTKERQLLEELEEWARKYSPTLSSRTLEKILDALDAVRKDFRKEKAHY